MGVRRRDQAEPLSLNGGSISVFAHTLQRRQIKGTDTLKMSPVSLSSRPILRDVLLEQTLKVDFESSRNVSFSYQPHLRPALDGVSTIPGIPN
jgi:hypothetical protein